MAAMEKLTAVYARAPISVDGGIPIYCGESAFRSNYDAIYEQVFEQIEAGQDPNEEAVRLEMERATIDLIREYAKGGRILDAGVAMGRMLSQLPDSFEKYGFDINVPCLRLAQARGVDVCCAMVEDLPYREGAFDAVIMSDFLEHVLDLNLTVKNVLATLRPGGLLFVRTPWREDLSIYLRDDYPFPYHHLRSFDEHGYRLLLEKIFPCKVLEHRLIGYSVCPERRKWMVPFCGRATKYSRAVSQALHDRLIRLFYLPLKIVLVAQKL